MGEGIAHIISPASAVWCSWTMLVLLLCGILSELFQPGVISQAKNSLITQTDRVYKESPNNFMGQLMIHLFRLGVITMAMYLCCVETGYFSFTGFWAIFGITLVMNIIKLVCNYFMDFTFQLTRRFGNAHEHYGNILTLIVLAIYPVLLVLLRYGAPQVNRWVLGTMAVIFLLLWFYRAFRQFITTPRAIGYLFIYFCTIELLPWVLLYILSNQIISQI